MNYTKWGKAMEEEEPPGLSIEDMYRKLVEDLLDTKTLEKEDVDKKEKIINYINNIVNI